MGGNLTKYVASDSAPEDTSLLWIDTTDTTSDFEPLVVDATLTNRGEAAESKATGDKINELDNKFTNQIDNLNSDITSSIDTLSKKIYVQSTPPTDIIDGTIWIDTSEI
jgi:hypothetical protein